MDNPFTILSFYQSTYHIYKKPEVRSTKYKIQNTNIPPARCGILPDRIWVWPNHRAALDPVRLSAPSSQWGTPPSAHHSSLPSTPPSTHPAPFHRAPIQMNFNYSVHSSYCSRKTGFSSNGGWLIRSERSWLLPLKYMDRFNTIPVHDDSHPPGH